jgi:hypothetical protein
MVANEPYAPQMAKPLMANKIESKPFESKLFDQPAMLRVSDDRGLPSTRRFSNGGMVANDTYTKAMSQVAMPQMGMKPSAVQGGEIVIQQRDAKNIGYDYLKNINAMRFETGGIVGGGSSNATTPNTATQNGGEMGGKPSVNITININKDGSSSKEGGDSQTKDDMGKFAKIIELKVQEGIMEAMRAGGPLYSGQRR